MEEISALNKDLDNLADRDAFGEQIAEARKDLSDAKFALRQIEEKMGKDEAIKMNEEMKTEIELAKGEAETQELKEITEELGDADKPEEE